MTLSWTLNHINMATHECNLLLIQFDWPVNSLPQWHLCQKQHSIGNDSLRLLIEQVTYSLSHMSYNSFIHIYAKKIHLILYIRNKVVGKKGCILSETKTTNLHSILYRPTIKTQHQLRNISKDLVESWNFQIWTYDWEFVTKAILI